MISHDAAMSVRGLKKAYSITKNTDRHSTLAETLLHRLRRPFRRARKDTFWALDGLSFDIRRGEIVGIIGRNGAGKSTLLKILSRITEPTIGEVDLYGRVGSLLEVGTGFHPELTGRENVYLNGQILGMRRKEITKCFDEIVDFAEVEQFIDTPIKRYSSGMYVRLAFAVAAHLNPEILIIDEVLAVGDVKFQKKCLGKIGQVAKGGRTVLFVSHQMAAVSALCTRAILLSRGKCIDDGPATSVVRTYLSRLDEETGGEVAWKSSNSAPGDASIQLRAVRIVSDGRATADVHIESRIDVEFDYWNGVDGNEISSSMHLLDSGGVCILATGNAPKPHSRGSFRSVCTIPGDFLNNGRYFVSAFILKNATITDALAKEAVSFTVHEDHRRGDYMGPIIGMIRPTLPWSSGVLDGVSLDQKEGAA